MQIPPLDTLKSWPTPNYKDPVTRGPAPVIFNLVLIPLVCLFVSMRMFTRIHISKSFGIDDWLILAACIPTAAFAAITLAAQLGYNWNRHIWDVDPLTFSAGLKLIMASIVTFDLATCLTKLSMLTLTCRIIGDRLRILRNATIFVTYLVIIQGTIFVPAIIFQCRPPAQYWTLSFEPQTCINESALLLSAGTINTITDFLVVLLPIPTVWSLHLPAREQLIIILLFSVGFVISIVGGIRTYYTYAVSVSGDKTWAIFPVYLTASVELYIGLICACIPTAKKFLSHYMPRLFRSRSQETISLTDTKAAPANGPTRTSRKVDLEQGIEDSHSNSPPYEKNAVKADVESIAEHKESTDGFKFGSENRVESLRSSEGWLDVGGDSRNGSLERLFDEWVS